MHLAYSIESDFLPCIGGEFDVSAGSAGISFALEGGTLLGAVREGKMLAFEFDNDISIKKEDFDKLKPLKAVFLQKYGSVSAGLFACKLN